MPLPSTRSQLPESWPFEDPPDTLCITTNQIVAGDTRILQVRRNSGDGAWHFYGAEPVAIGDTLLAGIGTVCQMDPSIAEIADLPPGWHASRDKPGDPWHRVQYPFVGSLPYSALSAFFFGVFTAPIVAISWCFVPSLRHFPAGEDSPWDVGLPLGFIAGAAICMFLNRRFQWGRAGALVGKLFRLPAILSGFRRKGWG